MLDWSRAQLSSISGVSEPNIIRLEAGGDARTDTLRKLSDAFENQGIVFTATGGLEPMRSELRTYTSSTGLKAFMDDVYNTIKEENGGDIIITGVVEKDFSTHLGNDFHIMHMKRMSKLKNYTMRCLIEQGDHNFKAKAYCQYRWISSKQFRPVPFYIYGNRISFIQFNVAVDVPLIVVLQSKAITEAFRAQFDVLWDTAQRTDKV